MFLGAIVNFATVAVGGIIGSLAKSKLSKKITDAVMIGMALCVLYIGIDGLKLGVSGMNALVVILSMCLGILLGEWIDIDKHMNRFGDFLQRKISKKTVDGKENTFSVAIVSSTLLFCVGAMAINGSLMSAQGDHDILIAKSVIDGIACTAMASTLGIGCIFSAIPTLFYEGALTGIFYLVIENVDSTSFMYNITVNHIACVGSLVIITIALNMLGITKIKTANFIPAMFMPLAVCPIFNLLGIL